MSETQQSSGDEAEPPVPSGENGAAPAGAPAKARRKRGEKAAASAEGERTGNGASTEAAEPAPADPSAGEATDPAAAEPGESVAAEGEGPALLPEGNRLRVVRGSIAIAAGFLAAFVLMGIHAQLRFGVPLGALAVLVTTFGVLDLVGSFDDPDERVAGRATIAELARPLGIFAGGAFATWGLVSLAVAGRLELHLPMPRALAFLQSPVTAAAVLIPAAFLMTVVGAYQVGALLEIWDRRPDGSERPLLRRHGFWLVAAVTLIYLPVLGSHSLSDPWETHYGEVSREILARNDWISLWWAQDGWFWSKPVLDFWLQALAMATFGVHYQPDQMLSAAREGRIPWPEWAVRLPVFLLTLVAVYLLYKAVAKVFGRRAGLLGGIVLITMPQWFLVTHQTMTDMPFVAPMAAAMALLLLGFHSDPEEEVSVHAVDFGAFELRLSLYHLVLGGMVACAVPQIVYLFTRNFEFGPFIPHFHLDQFMSGSPGNCTLPGNDPCRSTLPVLRGLHPALQGLLWTQAVALVIYMNWGERRRQRLYFLAAWLFAAISTMAKGPAGVLLPILCALAYVMVSRRWRDLLRLEIASGSLIVLGVALPWFVAMYARHGQPFTDRLLFHDMFKRAFTHVHDTNEGDDTSFRFYVWQLGYAMFPWTGLVPAGLVWWMRRKDDGGARGDASVFLVMWFIFAFALFSLMLTKFHHYILPAVPPAAMLTGVLLDSMLRRSGRPAAALAEATSPLAREGHYRRAPASSDPDLGPVGSPRPAMDTAIYAGGLGVGTMLVAVGINRAIDLARLAAGGPGTPKVPFLQLLLARGIIVLGLAFAIGAAVYLYRRDEARKSDARDDAEPASALEDGVAPEIAEAAGEEPEAPAAAVTRAAFERVQLGAAAVAGAILVFFVGRDLSANFDGTPSQIRLLHLFTYNYRRGWPTSLDFTATLWTFTAMAALLTALLLWACIRKHVVYGLLALGVTFAVWGLDVYFMKTSPHWGQRETVMAYYDASRAEPGPLLAYQMNWKGENFYTGNHVPAFVSSGKKFQDYVQDERKKGQRVFYFMTEHARTGTLQNEIGSPKVFDKLTTQELNNKFVLVRAVFE